MFYINFVISYIIFNTRFDKNKSYSKTKKRIYGLFNNCEFKYAVVYRKTNMYCAMSFDITVNNCLKTRFPFTGKVFSWINLTFYFRLEKHNASIGLEMDINSKLDQKVLHLIKWIRDPSKHCDAFCDWSSTYMRIQKWHS